jgi:hypothetical protein
MTTLPLGFSLKPVVRFWNATPQPSVATRERWAAIASGSAFGEVAHDLPANRWRGIEEPFDRATRDA